MSASGNITHFDHEPWCDARRCESVTTDREYDHASGTICSDGERDVALTWSFVRADERPAPGTPVVRGAVSVTVGVWACDDIAWKPGILRYTPQQTRVMAGHLLMMADMAEEMNGTEGAQ